MYGTTRNESTDRTRALEEFWQRQRDDASAPAAPYSTLDAAINDGLHLDFDREDEPWHAAIVRGVATGDGGFFHVG